jgi:hypothetical protein
MLWWVSSVVFCGSIIGFLVFNLEKVEALPSFILQALFILVLLFFASVIIFGIITTKGMNDIGKEIMDIYNFVNCKIPITGKDIKRMTILIFTGTTSFIIGFLFILATWIYITFLKSN